MECESQSRSVRQPQRAVHLSRFQLLIPSFYRVNPAGGPPITLRPDTNYHIGFAPLADASGDVKNLADSPGYSNGPNDSVWVDVGFPVMTGPDGRKFKPLFAPLVQDLDNRVNVNIHGYYFCHPWIGGANSNYFGSHQGWGPWEVAINRVVTANPSGPEAKYLSIGNGATKGRYDLNFWGVWPFKLADQYGAGGPIYSMSNYDCYAVWDGGAFRLPGQSGHSATNCLPFCDWTYGNGGVHWTELYSHARNYNFFSPTQNGYSTSGAVAQSDRAFPPSHLEALLRYGDTGSPALESDLFRLCPQSFADPKTRRLVTTHAFDVLRPGVTSGAWDPAAQPYQLSQGSPYPSAGLAAWPTPGAQPPAGSEFGPNWTALAAALGRIDLNRTLPDYPDPDPNTKRIDLNNPQTALALQKAVQARQQMAREIFDVLRQTCGAADPAAGKPPPPQMDALRWLAQLAANVVDFVDIDDYMTPFKWYSDPNGNPQNDEWVFGTEMPWLVLNEAYSEIANDPTDTGAKAKMPYKVRFWAELHNPMNGATQSDGQTCRALVELCNARLQVPQSGNNPAYAAYQVVIAKNPQPNQPLPDLRKPSNSLGDADPGQVGSVVQIVVSDFTPEPAPAPQPLGGVDVNIVQPSAGSTSGTPGKNEGYYLLGPKDDFPGSDPTKPVTTLRVKDQQVNGQRSSMVYELPLTTDLTQLPQHTLLLRRLACPYLPPQTNPALPNYNPYVTVDYIDQLPTNDAVQADSNGAHAAVPVDKRSALGRNQPYAADKSQQAVQAPMPPLTNQPQHTFFKINTPATNPFDWLTFMDRPLVSPAELLQVSGYKPHELTQQFMTVDGMGNPQRFNHKAPWFDSTARIYRSFEFFEGGNRLQWSPIGGRTVGKININTIWDPETFNALGDAQQNNFFTANGVTKIFQRMLQSRTPAGTPGPSDRPFRGFAAPSIQPGLQYPQGSGVDDTFLRADPVNPQKRLFEPDPGGLRPEARDHPYLKYELMNKILTNVTNRSNVFAVWVTVGFFEVTNDSDLARPPLLGAEIGRSENRHVRHRMFAIVDRTNLTINQINPGQPGPFFIDSRTAVTATNQPTTIDLPAIAGKYEDLSWGIKTGDQLVIDVGQNQEIIQVTGVNQAPAQITATFRKTHGAGFAVSNAVQGYSGPQPRFDPRNPLFQGVVRYFSIIE